MKRDKSLIQKSPEKIDLNKRNFIKKGVLGLAGFGSVVAFSKLTKAWSILGFGDGTTQTTAATGNVVGPASSTAGNLPLYDSTTGKLLKDGPAPGAAGNVLTSDGVSWGSAVPATSATPVFTKSYYSGNLTLTSAGALTLAHGLGVVPKLFQIFIKCLVAELGYSVGNLLVVSVTTDGNTDYGIALVPDATYLNIRMGAYSSVFIIQDKGTGGRVNITNTSWALVVRAWA